MKYSIYINQEFCITNAISVQEAIVLSALCEAPTWSIDVVIDGSVWYWISKTTLEQELPIIGTWSNFKRIKQSLKDKGFIDYTVLGNKQLFRLTENGKRYSRGRIVSQQGQENVPPLHEVGQENVPVLGQKNVPNHITNYHKTNKNHMTNNKSKGGVCRPDDVDEQVWFDYLKLRDSKTPLTQTALSMISKEAEKAGYTLEQALQTCCLRGWKGFKAEWVKNKSDEMTIEQLSKRDFTQTEYDFVL